MNSGKNKIKCVILAGGLGTRLSEYTKTIPKPLVKIGNRPILMHIIDIFLKFYIKDFYILTGYKGELINNFFETSKQFKIEVNKNKYSKFKNKHFDYNINLINTGVKTKTGLRLKKVEKYFNKDENFFLTYGDGLSDVNLSKLLNYHLTKNSSLTLTAVRPPARFGEVIFKGEKIKSFEEKNNINAGWINGGFMVVNKSFFNFLTSENQMLEREPFQKCLKHKKLFAFKHYKFWQCMDNLRDKELLDNLVKKNYVPWTQ